MVTWVRFRERRTSREFFFWNTHLDHEVELARQKGAALIVERADKLKSDLPLILTGDFNAPAGSSPTYDILVKNGGFSDTWTRAGERIHETLSTFHGFKAPVHTGSRIDWILTRGPVAVQKIEIVTCSAGGQYPSDHFPVLASLVLAGVK
jgi:endonuclease/exonuclease/phosphatase family metal-dependent hydrolase